MLVSDTKVCITCGEEKPLDQFRRQRRSCRDCINKARRDKRAKIICEVPTEKLCANCGCTKPAGDFHKNSKSIDGLQSWCKECKATRNGTRNDYLRQYYLENKERLNEYGKAYQKTDKGRAVTRATKYRRKAVLQDGDVTGADILKLVELSPRCFWCGALHNGVYQLDHFEPLSKGGIHTLSNLVIACPSCNMSKSNKDPEVFAEAIGRNTSTLYEEDLHDW